MINHPNVKKIMEQEGIRLMNIVQKYIDEYYDSYKPTVYERTYAFKNSLRIEPVTQKGNILSVKIYFDDDSANHPSIFGGSDGYVPLLINDGWSWKNTQIAPYRLSHYEGFNFIEKAIEEYEKSNKYGFKIQIERNV